MNRFRFSLCVLMFVSFRVDGQDISIQAPAREDFRPILEFLSSDLMEGRETGTRGAALASEYIASMMRLSGLHPYGDPDKTGHAGKPFNDAFFQEFPAIRCHVAQSSLAIVHRNPDGESSLIFASGTDYTVEALPFGRETQAPLVFCGYGISEPLKGYDDYQGTGVKDRIVLILDGSPGHSDTTSTAWKRLGKTFGEDYGSESRKIRTAEKKGAVAVIIVNPRLLQGPVGPPAPPDPDEDGFRHFLPGDTSRTGIPCFRLEAAAARRLVMIAGIDVRRFEEKASAGLIPGSCPVRDIQCRASVITGTGPIAARNVLGILHGRDTTRNIIIGAHYDHLGIRNGKIFNGADDNASGVAGVLALARKWATSGEIPACNIIFAAWAGEEIGKLGSRYFAGNSGIVPGKVSLVINLDMISRSAPEDTAGNQLSIGTMTRNEDLRNLAKQINSRIARPLILDLWDVTGHAGSDYAPFYERNISILTFHAGFPDEYHTPGDDFFRTDPGKMERILQIVNGCLLRETGTAGK